jgi:hypothetical protein
MCGLLILKQEGNGIEPSGVFQHGPGFQGQFATLSATFHIYIFKTTQLDSNQHLIIFE